MGTQPLAARPCPGCLEPLEEGAERGTCAGCGSVYHVACIDRHRRCLRSTCPHHRPSHARWTLEARAKGLWLHLPSPPVPGYLRRLLAFLVVPMAGVLSFPCLPFYLGVVLTKVFPDLPAWLVVAATTSLVVVPATAFCGAIWHQYAQYRPALLDDDGVLLGYKEQFSGFRLRWSQVLGYKLRTKGIELVLKGRPWTRWVLAPMLVCDERVAHDVTVILEQHGIVNAEG